MNFLNAAKRCLGQFDLNPRSPTYGCPDRNFWHYQDGKGFAVASPLAAFYGFSVAAETEIENENIFSEAVEAGLSWWSKTIQQFRGVDEYFKNQNSFCALAHTTLSVALTLSHKRRRNLSINPLHLEALRIALDRLAKDSTNPESANQSLAGHLAYDICSSQWPEMNLDKKRNPFLIPLDKQSKAPLEYGGYDLGYSLKSLNLCVLALLNLPVESIGQYKEIIESTLSLLDQLVVQFTFSPDISSRGNPHKLLGGLTLLDNAGAPRAKPILEALTNRASYNSMVTAETSDDKYLSFFHLTDLSLSKLEIPDQVKRITWQPLLPAANDELLETERFIHFRSKEARLTISLQGGGVVLCDFQNGPNYLWGQNQFFRNGKLYKVSGQPVAAKKMIDRDRLSFEIPIYISPQKSNALWLQSLLPAIALRVLLNAPIIKILFRNWIYKKSFKLPSSSLAGVRTVTLRPQIQFEDKYHAEWEEIWQAQHWSFKDGHSTRLHSSSKVIFKLIGKNLRQTQYPSK